MAGIGQETSSVIRVSQHAMVVSLAPGIRVRERSLYGKSALDGVVVGGCVLQSEKLAYGTTSRIATLF
jgi:hypothetical protein